MSAVENLVGIDLGTSYSSIAVLDERGYAQTVLNELNEASTPSVVFFSDEGPVVGTPAERAYLEFPDRVVFHSKRCLGHDGKVWEIDGVEYTPVDIAALILRKLKRDAERRIGTIRRAVVSVPAHFNSHQRELTLEAAEQAGLDILEIVNEPVAAALCYVLGEEGIAFSALSDAQRVLVYDLGGGTFDLSLVDYQANDIRVLCANGDLKLGGIDWNQRLIDYVADDAIAKHGVNPRAAGNRRMFAELATAVERAKRDMSQTKEEVGIKFRMGRSAAETRIDRKEFELLTGDLLDRTRMLLQQVIKSAPARTGEKKPGGWSDIDAMLLVGGSSRMPMVREMVMHLVKRVQIKPIDPELSVAHGAALYAGLLASKAGTNGVARDVLHRLGAFGTKHINTLTLGLLVRNDAGERILHPLIPKDTPLPATARVFVSTFKNDQRRVSLKIVEAGQTSEVCRCVLHDLPPRLPEGSRFSVDLTYNPSGILHVVAQHEDTGLLSTVAVHRNA